MSEPRIAFVSREVYPFDSAGLGNYVTFTAGALAEIADVSIITTAAHEPIYHELVAGGDARLPAGVRFEFVAEPTLEQAAGWYGQLHLWSARAYEALVRLYPDGGPDLVEFPDYLGEACVTAQAKQILDRRLRNTLVCIRAYTTAEMCAVLDGHLPDDRETRYVSEIERFALRHSDCFLWPGGGVLDAYRAFYGEAHICAPVEVPHTVSLGPAPTAPPDYAGPLRFLYVGRLERRKGVQNLIRAATSLPDDDWSLTLVGGDTPTAPLGRSMRAQLELMIAGDSRISLRSRIPRDQVAALYSAAHVCISPSLWECWPNTVLEAFEQNRPVLATPVGGHLGMIEAGRDGWLVEDTSSDALARRMEQLIRARDGVVEVIRTGAPREKFARLADPEPVRERYGDLISRRGKLGSAARRAARGVRPQPQTPLVSVVIPYFHMERFVELTLASVAAQTYARIETIVINDGSLRDQDAVLEKLASRYKFSLATQINSGLGQARNLGIELSRGQYVLPLDPDDELMPSFVERAVAVLDARPELAYVTAWSEFMSEDGQPLAPDGYRPLGNQVGWLEHENLAGSAMAVFRRRLFDRGLRYSPDLTGYEDWLLYRELTAAGELGYVIPEHLLKYRVRSASMLRTVAKAGNDRLMAELRAQVREREVAWTRSNG